jgi:hypothetical protein
MKKSEKKRLFEESLQKVVKENEETLKKLAT